jgi:uncharacterized protein YndB with AHSA1/START domain
MTSTTVQVHRVYIKATPQAIWDAITKPEWTERYGYSGRFDTEPKAGQPFRILTTDETKKAGAEMGYEVPDVAVDGEAIEVDPPRKLVLSWRMAMDPDMAAEGFTRLTYEIEEVPGGATKLTIVHDLTGAPKLAAMVAGEHEAEGAGGGWAWVLSDLKSLLETGTAITAGQK